MGRAAAVGGAPAADIFERLLAEDPTAPADLAEAYLDDLSRWLIARHPGLDEHVCATAAEDAILALIKRPDAYEPGRQTLDVYLRLSARGDLKNALRSEGRHRSRRVDLEAVELSPEVGKYQGRADDPARIVLLWEEIATRAAALPTAAEVGLTVEDERVLILMRSGERRTAAFAAVLGIADRPAAEQRREVKRAKDRLKKRIERMERDGR